MFNESNTTNPQNKEFKNVQPTSKIYNPAGISANQLMGINRVVNLKIIIEGTTVNHYKHFTLVQNVAKHHEFKLVLAFNSLGTAENHNLENSQSFLGKRLTVVFGYKGIDESPERTFVGVISEVGFEQEQGSLGNIILSGYSPTVLLDMAPHIQSFGGSQTTNLSNIASSVIKEGISSKYDIRVDPEYTKEISYSCQYNETHYNYLARMAEAYGEQFFYDGEVLHFGKLPPQENTLELIYGSNVSDIKVNMRMVHVNPTFYGYNSNKHEKLTTGESTIKHKSDIGSRAYDISLKSIPIKSLRVAPIRATTFKDISASQKSAAGSSAVNVFVTTGKVSIPFLYPGCTANIKMRKPDSNATSHFTKLMITAITHEVDEIGNYTGEFEAIAADTGFLPRPEFEFPDAETQMATVMSNTDPKNQGRIQVRFDWQLHETTDFIRVMTPDAGGSDKVSKNRGFMAIPEVGDQVMVHFVHNHPDRPFVMGAMYHGKVGAGGGAGNNIRSFSSKSGNIVKLNDGAGIEIKDKAGNHVTLSGTGNLTTEISADYTEEIGGKLTTHIVNEHKLNIDANSTINIANDVTIDVGDSKSVLKMDKAGNISIEGKTQIELKVGKNSITIKKDSISISVGDGMLDMNSKDNALLVTQKNLSIHSKSHTSMNATENIYITGNQVDIN